MSTLQALTSRARSPRALRLARTVAGAALALAAGAACAVPAQTWNLSNELRLNLDSPNPTNPYGAWTYMYAPLAQVHSGYQNYTPMPDFAPACWDGTTHCWRVNSLNSALPAVWVDDVTELEGTASETAGVPVLHPGPLHAAIVRWTSPVTAMVKVVGRFTDIDANGGDGVGWFIDRNGVTLHQGSAWNAVGPMFAFSVHVNVGQTLDFIVESGPAHDFYNDSTQLDVLIAAQP
jgi:hypothetical protein